MNRTPILVSFFWAYLVWFLVFNVDRCETGSLGRRFSALQRYGQFIKPKVLQLQSRFLLPLRLPSNPEVHMTSAELIQSRGYQVETHLVTTDDGYILKMLRIPAKNPNSKAVFLQHGVIDSDATFLITPKSNSLAFQLSDLGYDVWLGNSRGTTSSRGHVFLDPNDLRYWDFSWDELGKYDIPANINYILATNGQSKLVYVGHSLGSASFFIAMIKHPELKDKIDMMIALSPSSTFMNFNNYLQYFFPFSKKIQLLGKLFGLGGVLERDGLYASLTRKICNTFYVKAYFCRINYLQLAGPVTGDYLPLEMMPMINARYPAGASFNTLIQIAQHYNADSQVFQAFDYGKKENLERYGTPYPEAYDLSQVTVPVYIFYGEKDAVVPPADVKWLASQLGNVQALVEIPDYNHDGPVHGSNAKEVLYNQIFPLLPPP